MTKIANFDEDHANALGGSTAVIAETQADAAVADHAADTTEAHQATGVAILDATDVRYGPLPWLTSGAGLRSSYYGSDNVEGALAEIGEALRVLAGTGVRYGPLPSLTSAASALGGMANPMTTQDDIIVGGVSGAPARLGKGTDGQVLTVDPTTHHLLWASPAGGSAGGGIAAVHKVVASATAAISSPFPTSDTPVDSLTLTFSLAATADVIITCDIRMTRGAGGDRARCRIYDDTTQIAPDNEAGFSGWYSYAVDESTYQQIHFSTIQSLASGSHTINVKWQAAVGTSSANVYDRSLVVEVLA